MVIMMLMILITENDANDTEDDDEDAGDDDAVDADLDIVDTARLKSAEEISIQDKSGDQGLQMFVLHILHNKDALINISI